MGQLSFTLAPHFFDDLGNVALQQPLVAGGGKKHSCNEKTNELLCAPSGLHMPWVISSPFKSQEPSG